MATFGPKLSRRERVRINTDPVFLALADGLFAAAEDIGAEAESRVHDAPPTDSPWADWHKHWAAAAWALGKKVAGAADKPRPMRTTRRGADAVVGFPFPGRLHETGTEFQPARPFLGPAALEYVTSSRFPATLAAHFPDDGP
jgi:hypothetical protein